jgi:arylsulfatase A-like enzyme
VVVVVSDHGEQLGEHGLFGHGSSLYEELLHVPLVVLGPPDLVGRGSERERVSTQALYEAVQAWARCERPSLNDGPVFAEGEGMWYQPVVQRLQAEPSLEAKLKATAWAVYEGDWKYVRDETGVEALFDLADDPSETHDIGSTGPLDEMRDVMAKALAGRRPRVSHERPDVAGEMDPEVEAQLRSLGYM